MIERFNFSELHRKRISLPRLGPVVILLLHRQTVAILIVYGGVVRGFKKWRFVRRRRFLSVRQVQIRRASIRQRVQRSHQRQKRSGRRDRVFSNPFRIRQSLLVSFLPRRRIRRQNPFFFFRAAAARQHPRSLRLVVLYGEQILLQQRLRIVRVRNNQRHRSQVPSLQRIEHAVFHRVEQSFRFRALPKHLWHVQRVITTTRTTLIRLWLLRFRKVRVRVKYTCIIARGERRPHASPQSRKERRRRKGQHFCERDVATRRRRPREKKQKREFKNQISLARTSLITHHV